MVLSSNNHGFQSSKFPSPVLFIISSSSGLTRRISFVGKCSSNPTFKLDNTIWRPTRTCTRKVYIAVEIILLLPRNQRRNK